MSQSRFAHPGALTAERQKSVVEKVKKVNVSRVDPTVEYHLKQMLEMQRACQWRAKKMELEFPDRGYNLGVDCYGADIRYAVVFRKVKFVEAHMDFEWDFFNN